MKSTYMLIFKLVRWSVAGVAILIIALPALTSASTSI